MGDPLPALLPIYWLLQTSFEQCGVCELAAEGTDIHTIHTGLITLCLAHVASAVIAGAMGGAVIEIEGLGVARAPGGDFAIVINPPSHGTHLQVEGDLLCHIWRHVLQAGYAAAWVSSSCVRVRCAASSTGCPSSTIAQPSMPAHLPYDAAPFDRARAIAYRPEWLKNCGIMLRLDNNTFSTVPSEGESTEPRQITWKVTERIAASNLRERYTTQKFLEPMVMMFIQDARNFLEQVLLPFLKDLLSEGDVRPWFFTAVQI
jgi:hypothetical protein